MREKSVLRPADCIDEPGKPTPTVKMIAVYIPTTAHFVLDQTVRSADTAIPSKTGEKRWPVVAARVPSPKLAASVKQAIRRTRDGMVGSIFAVAVITIAPMAVKNKAGCRVTKARIIGAMIKAAALSPVVRLNEDFSRCMISLKNRLIHELFFTAWVGTAYTTTIFHISIYYIALYVIPC
jgi:hypothetical protein